MPQLKFLINSVLVKTDKATKTVEAISRFLDKFILAILETTQPKHKPPKILTAYKSQRCSSRYRPRSSIEADSPWTVRIIFNNIPAIIPPRKPPPTPKRMVL